jgi:hypothetical protein
MKRKSTKTSLQQPSLFFLEEQKAIERAKCVRYDLWWEQVKFEKGLLRLNHPKTILKPLTLKGSLDVLDKIKIEYFERLLRKKFITLYYLDKLFKPELSKDWGKIIDLIEPAVEYATFRFKTSDRKKKIGRFKKLSPKQVFDIYEHKFSKNEYLKFLAKKQSSDYNIIPILEWHHNQEEESFIFCFNAGSGRILIAWENSKEGRATYFFIAGENNLEERLKLIESFVIDATKSKRSMFHVDTREARTIKKQLMWIETLNHDSIETYRPNLQFIIDKY